MSLRKLVLAGAAAVGVALPSLASAQMLAQVSTDLNLRAGPGTGYPVITTMPRGAQVHVHQCPTSWCQVSYGGTTGWASHRHLTSGVALQPRTYAVAPEPRVAFGLAVGPRYRYAPPYPYDPRWHSIGPGWYDDVYWDGRRWYYEDDWHYRPRSSFSITFGG